MIWIVLKDRAYGSEDYVPVMINVDIDHKGWGIVIITKAGVSLADSWNSGGCV